MRPPRKCENAACGKEFVPKTGKARFCSNRCRAAHWKEQNNRSWIEREAQAQKLESEAWQSAQDLTRLRASLEYRLRTPPRAETEVPPPSSGGYLEDPRRDPYFLQRERLRSAGPKPTDPGVEYDISRVVVVGEGEQATRRCHLAREMQTTGDGRPLGRWKVNADITAKDRLSMARRMTREESE